MYNIGSAFYHLKDVLQHVYDEREAAAIAHETMNHITGLSRTSRLIHKETMLDDAALKAYESALTLLVRGVPLQYVTGTAWFMGTGFEVNEHVLIPRPETEELVQWVVDDCNELQPGGNIIDVGTGSGCIPISLKRLLPGADVASCDVSKEALTVAAANATALNEDVTFLQLDFLDTSTHDKLGVYDVIISNPPYIPVSEKDKLHINVSEHEPALALFVPDDDALIFYKALACFGKTHLKVGGSIYCELDAEHANQTKALFEMEGYQQVTLRQDIHGNMRMLKASGF